MKGKVGMPESPAELSPGPGRCCPRGAAVPVVLLPGEPGSGGSCRRAVAFL